jgi:hypothetical protein
MVTAPKIPNTPPIAARTARIVMPVGRVGVSEGVLALTGGGSDGGGSAGGGGGGVEE